MKNQKTELQKLEQKIKNLVEVGKSPNEIVSQLYSESIENNGLAHKIGIQYITGTIEKHRSYCGIHHNYNRN